MRKTWIGIGAVVFALVPWITGCESEAPSGDGKRQVTLQLNWKPEPEFGPFYAAAQNGHFAAEGLEVELRPGGSGAPTTDLLATGQVPFAIVSGDQIVLARAVGKKIVGIFAVYQKDPTCFMTPKARGIGSFRELMQAPGTLAMERGMPFVSWIEKTIGLGPARVVPSPYGDLKYLRSDPDYAMQAFATAEPVAARKQGIDVDVFLVADAGFNPYQTILAVHEDTLATDPDLVRRMLRATTAGWRDYLEAPQATNETMAKLNPTMDLETFAAIAETQKPHVINEATTARGPGTMNLERWARLVQQMTESGVVPSPVEPRECFRDPVDLLAGN
jgi:NitT/TauT family transport system substrate-binding protein